MKALIVTALVLMNVGTLAHAADLNLSAALDQSSQEMEVAKNQYQTETRIPGKAGVKRERITIIEDSAGGEELQASDAN